MYRPRSAMGPPPPRIAVDYDGARKMADTYMFKLEQYIGLNVRRPAWMPMWLFKRLMWMIVIEESPLRVRLDNEQSDVQK